MTRKQQKHDLLLRFYEVSRKPAGRRDWLFTRKEVVFWTLELLGMLIGILVALNWNR